VGTKQEWYQQFDWCSGVG